MVEFEWDEDKRHSNLEKHKLDFRVARRLFDGRPLFTTINVDHDEPRRVALTGIAITRSPGLSETKRSASFPSGGPEMQKSGPTVSYTAEEIDEMLARGGDQSDYAAADAMTEEELEAAIASDPDEAGLHPDLGNWDNVMIGLPEPKRQMTVRFDGDIIEWFKESGRGYQTRMNTVLRSYVEAQKRRELERRKRERAGKTTGE